MGLAIIFWFVVLTPVGLILGLLLSPIGFRILYALRGIPVEEKTTGCWAKFIAAVLFCIVFVPSTLAFLILYLPFRDEDNFWEYKGAFDYWRMPLEEPYELSMIDSLDKAAISRWEDSSGIVWGILKYEKRGRLLAGYYEHDSLSPKESGWFLFDCGTGRSEHYDSEGLLEAACAQRGFAPPLDMRSVSENWAQYWGNPDRRRQ